MKTIRRFLLLFSLAGCCGIPWLAPLAVGEDVDSPTVPPIAALRASATDAPPPPPSEDAAQSAPKTLCAYLVTVADDFIVEVYHNGKRVPEEQREMLLDRFGATAEKIHVQVREGDWLVFHVVQDRLRWGGAKYFAVAGCLAENEFGFVSDPASAEWSVCDDPGKAGRFIHRRNFDRNVRAAGIETPWEEGNDHMKEFAGRDFAGKSLWGRQPSTWIKFIAGGTATPEAHEPVGESPAANSSTPAPAAPVAPGSAAIQPCAAKKWPVQILSAIYGTGGKNADVTAKVKEYVETLHHMFTVNPTDLGADPNPYWNKGLQISYMKDGVHREQNRNENEYVLPESFYGPQDAAELRGWLPETRWYGEQPDIQFHADQTFTSPGVPGTNRWEATGPNTMRLTWNDGRTVEYTFDYTWSSFSEPGNGHNVFHLQK